MSEIQAQWYGIWDKSYKQLFEKLRAAKLLLTPSERDANEKQIEQLKKSLQVFDKYRGTLLEKDELCRMYDAMKAERDANEERIAELEVELETLTEMHSDAWKRALKMWQDETGRTDTWPDAAKHYAYLMGKITDLDRECEIHCEMMTKLQENLETDIEKLKEENEELTQEIHELGCELDFNKNAIE